MRPWNTAIRAPLPYLGKRAVVAIILTAVVMPLLAVSWLWLFPSACDIRGDPDIYHWSCLLPALMVPLPIGVALVLSLAFSLNRRLARPLPDGWLVVIPVSGAFTQIVLYGAYLLTLDAAYREIFLDELLMIPQPFVAGAAAGAVFWVSLHWRSESP